MRFFRWIRKHAIGICVVGAYYFHYWLEYLYASYKLHVRTDGWLLTEDVLQHIKKCANSAYPSSDFFGYDDCDSVADLLKQMSCSGLGQVYAFTGEDWYMLVICHPTYVALHDFASASGVCADIMGVYSKFRALFKHKRCIMCCRECTSYPLILTMKRFHRIDVLKDKVISKNGEVCHVVQARFTKSNGRSNVRSGLKYSKKG